MVLTIGQVAKATGVTAKTIRYYEQMGVLASPGRTAAGYRQYTEHGVQQLLFIRRARALGLSLHRLKDLAAVLNGGSRAAMRPRLLALVHAHLATVRRQISDLQLVQRQLEQVLRRRPSPQRPAGGCRCFELASPPGRPARPDARPSR